MYAGQLSRVVLGDAEDPAGGVDVLPEDVEVGVGGEEGEEPRSHHVLGGGRTAAEGMHHGEVPAQQHKINQFGMDKYAGRV